MIAPSVGTLVLALVLVWAWRKRRRRPVPGGPVIHRALLEEAEREVKAMDRKPDDDFDWGPGSPRSPIHL